MVRNKKELEILLSKVPRFQSPSLSLEQYTCDSPTAAEMLWLAYMNNDIEGKVVADLGCGTGMLSYGALLLGSQEVICIDIDPNPLKLARKFILDEGLHLFEAVNSDVENLMLRNIDTVIMNPPFGVHRRGLDIAFLKSALRLRPRALYSIHKYNPESHRIIYEVVENSGYTVMNTVVRFMYIPMMYPTHRKKTHWFKIAIYMVRRRV